MSDARFDRAATLIEALCPAPYHGGALSMIRPDGTTRTAHFGAAKGRGSPRLRVASISKSVTSGIAVEAAAAGLIDLATPLTTALGWPEDSPVSGITLDHLLSHTSGLTDHAGYIIEPPETLPGFLCAQPAALSGTSPGAFFRYANLGYTLLGLALESLLQTRFDHLARRFVLGPAGCRANFNWASTAPDIRATALPLTQRQGDALVVTADGLAADWSADLLWRDGQGHSLAAHRLGRDTVFFSPHAGLRASAPELAALARWFARDTAGGRLHRAPQWRFTPQVPNGEDCDGLFTGFARGLTLYEDHPAFPAPLIGHAGDALGFAGGAWWAPAQQTAWGYYLTGATDRTADLDREVFYPEEEHALLTTLLS